MIGVRDMAKTILLTVGSLAKMSIARRRRNKQFKVHTLLHPDGQDLV